MHTYTIYDALLYNGSHKINYLLFKYFLSISHSGCATSLTPLYRLVSKKVVWISALLYHCQTCTI